MPEREPQIFFLPLAVPETDAFIQRDAGVLARRFPDFVHLLLNCSEPGRGDMGPTGMLEIQSPPGEGPVRWVVLPERPLPEDVFPMIEEPEKVRAVVTGSLSAIDGGYGVEFSVYFAQAEHSLAYEVRGSVGEATPAQDLSMLAGGLAQVLGVNYSKPDAGLLTKNADAFFRFLDGLDGAALLSSDPSLESDQIGEALMLPFAEALTLDPQFGLALRTAAMTLPSALEGERVGQAECCRMIDRCFESLPADGEGCVAVADHLAVVGENERSRAWLEHAARLLPPPPRALESLGVVLANEGDLIGARNLWMQGMLEDGHPDFFAHLARLAFNGNEPHEGWDKALRGLRRLYEREIRAAEWVDDERGVGVLLSYLAEHLDQQEVPDDVVEALTDLSGLFQDAEARVHLGICLIGVGRDDHARVDLNAAIATELRPSVRDRAVRALLGLQFHGFERRFARATDLAVHGRDPKMALGEMKVFLDAHADFWPALFFASVALRRLGRLDEALACAEDVLQIRPGQVDGLAEMATLFNLRGNSKRAVECMLQAIAIRPGDAKLYLTLSGFYTGLGRHEDAQRALDAAIDLDPNESLLRQRRGKQ